MQAARMDELFRRTERASDEVAVTRADASESVVSLLRGLEKRLRDALDGDSLRGLVDLGNGCVGANLTMVYFFNGEPFGTMTKDGRTLYCIDRWLPLGIDGRVVLICDKHGLFLMARRTGDGYETRPVRDDEIRAEWLDLVPRALEVVLERHLDRTLRTAASYSATADLARKIACAVKLLQ